MSLFSRKKGPVVKTTRFDMHWDTEDPFIFVSHHEDDYPHGNRQMAPPLQEISGRDLGRDYEKRFGFRMYNGKVVPGFPMHAHWGYETVTLAQLGFVDHFDSEKREGRFGNGDIQWVSASSKYMHDEMYPLVDQDGRNPNDITQIMINLPLASKNRGNQVSTVWSGDVPVVTGNGAEVKVVCGRFGGHDVRSPNSNSWADGSRWVRILRMELEPGATLSVDAAPAEANRNVYMVSGDKTDVCGTEMAPYLRATVRPDIDMVMTNGESRAVLWLLEGEPIGEKQASFGPVYLGSTDEVRSAMEDIRRNEYSEWPFDVVDKVHLDDCGRFLRNPDGSEERP